MKVHAVLDPQGDGGLISKNTAEKGFSDKNKIVVCKKQVDFRG